MIMNETIVASIASAAVTLVVMLLVVLKIRKHPGSVQAEIDAEKQRSESALAIARAKEENLNRRLEDKDEACRLLLESKDEACVRALSEKDEACRKFVEAQVDACEKAKQELTENCRAAVEEKDAACKRLLAEKDDAYLKAVNEKETVLAQILAEKDESIKKKEDTWNRLLSEKDSACKLAIAEKEASCKRLLDEKDASCAAAVAEKESVCRKLLAEKDLELGKKEESCKALIDAKTSACERLIRDKDEQIEKLAKEKDAELRKRDEDCKALIDAKTADCERLIRDKNEQIEKLIKEKERSFAETVKTLQEQFANLAEQKLKSSTEGLSEINQKRIGEIIKPFREEIERFRQAFDEDKKQQVANKASFDQAITDLGKRALQIGVDAENLAKALKSESKTQGDWGEMVLSNILAAAGLKEGVDFVPQAQEVDAQGNKLIPDIEILLPNKEKLLIDSKASVTAYLDYVAAKDEVGKELAVKEHIASVRKHMDELADKDYIKKVRGSQGYILMFIPNEGSYLLAMEHDRKLATDAFRRHVIIVNPTTLLLCLQIVALLRSREAQNENAEKISVAAAKMYEKFVGFSDTFSDIGKRLDGLTDAYRKANGQLCDGNANVVRQLERLKEMGIVTTKTINRKMLEDAMAVDV